MQVIKDIFVRLGIKGRRRFELAEDIQLELVSLTEQEKRTPDEITAELIYAAFLNARMGEKTYKIWQTLSGREQDVAGFVCLGYTSRQISGRLHLSENTVRTYTKNVLRKFNVHSRDELGQALVGFDFSAWEKHHS
jgi:DNA-binding NarL/FixJ family response regulator